MEKRKQQQIGDYIKRKKKSMRFRLLDAFSELTNKFFNETFDYVIMCRHRPNILDRTGAHICIAIFNLRRETASHCGDA